MYRFARVVLGYQGCHAAFANDLFSNEDVIVERWGDDTPALDLEHHKYRVVGVKLTPEGQERVRLLAQELDPDRVWSAPVAVAR